MSILSIIDVMRVTDGFVRPLREGEQVLSSGFVVSVGLKEKTGSTLHVQALVLRTSGLASQHPYLVQLWIDVVKIYGERFIRDQSECACPAGQSQKCKHVIAVMLYLARIEEEDLYDLSCTDVQQQWGSLKACTLAEYEVKRLTDLCHVKPKRDAYVSPMPKVTKEMEKEWVEKLSACAPLSEYFIFHSHLRKGEGVVDEAHSVPIPTRNFADRSFIYKLLSSHCHPS